MHNLLKSLFDGFQPPYFNSTIWKNRIAIIDEKTCPFCRERHGKIYPIDELLQLPPPVHPHCRCEVSPMKSVIADNATKDGLQGADYYVKMFGELPENYITIEEAKVLGWKNILGNLDKVAPGKQITKGSFFKS